MRPERLDEFVGQEHLMASGSAFRSAVEKDQISSLILWGPPGTGKTTLGRLIANETGRAFCHISAVTDGIKAIKEVVAAARARAEEDDQGTILFIDEIHRFNKMQQDALLPHVEDGTLTMIGATTENPSFEVNAALLSRCKVCVLNALGEQELRTILQRALTSNAPRGLGDLEISVGAPAEDFLVSLAMGDARILLNNLELASLRIGALGVREITVPHVEEAAGAKALLYDKDGEEHYNLISALHKSLRGSDPQAALYYLMRMLGGGEDPLYIARRMVRFASEDVGLADPQALGIALDCVNAVRFLGLPECDTALAQAAIYLATAPKSNALYRAVKKAAAVIEDTGHLPVPAKLRNAPTKLMKKLGYGRGYRYPHDVAEAYVPEAYLPDEIVSEIFYAPAAFGFEREVRKRLAYWNRLREKAQRDES